MSSPELCQVRLEIAVALANDLFDETKSKDLDGQLILDILKRLAMAESLVKRVLTLYQIFCEADFEETPQK